MGKPESNEADESGKDDAFISSTGTASDFTIVPPFVYGKKSGLLSRCREKVPEGYFAVSFPRTVK